MLVKVSAEMFAVPGDQLLSGECAVSRCVQVRKHLLKFDSIVHIQEVLNKIAKSSLFNNVLAGERLEVSQSASHILTSLVHGTAILLFFETMAIGKPRVLKGFGSCQTVIFFSENATN